MIYLILIMILTNCSSYDLGKEKHKSVAVNEAAPNWEDDIAPLIEMKCANCHSPLKGGSVPKNTPSHATLDRLDERENFRTLASSIYTRVFESERNPMPPRFATPLSVAEKAALKKYLELLGVFTCPTSTNLTYQDLAPVIGNSCATAGCHVSGGSRTDLSTLANIRNARSQVLTKLQIPAGTAGAMPPASSNGAAFYESAERVRFMQWLCAGRDL